MTIDECARIEALISAQQDGAATPVEWATIERHVADCARCRATVAAFGQVDRQVRRYLMATPVPEIASPWRSEPPPLPARQGRSLGHWRATTAGLAAIFALIFTASILTFQPFTTNEPQSASFTRPTTEAAADGGAPGAAQIAATNTPNQAAVIAVAPAAPAQPTAAAAARSGAASAAPTGASSAAGAVPPASTRQPAAMAGAASESPANPAQLFRLGEATELRICRPTAGWCDAQPRTPEEQAMIVAALNRPLQRLTPPPATGSDQVVVMTFRFAAGEERVITYHYPTGRLTLPDNVEVQGSPELATLLGGIIAPR